MRTLKFRGQSINTGKWVYGYFKKNVYGDCYIEDERGLATVVDPETVGQFVCLDANINEVYEGDYVVDGTGQETIWEVVWDQDSHEFVLKDDISCIEHSKDLECTEVIGNRFDNQDRKF